MCQDLACVDTPADDRHPRRKTKNGMMSELGGLGLSTSGGQGGSFRQEHVTRAM